MGRLMCRLGLHKSNYTGCACHGRIERTADTVTLIIQPRVKPAWAGDISKQRRKRKL